MADVRSLLRNERAARRISHPHATYSTTGTLVCLVCHIQLKSESLWNSHLRSAQHAMRLQRIRDGTLGRPPGAPAPESHKQDKSDQDGPGDPEHAAVTNGEMDGLSVIKSKKRKADEGEEQVRKRSKGGVLPEDFFDDGTMEDSETVAVTLPTNGTPPTPGQEIKLPSRPATPLKTPESFVAPKVAAVDEEEWAAFEADIAATEAPITEDAVISAPAISAAELTAKSREEQYAQRKEQQEAEIEDDKEDATRKLEDEFEEMEALEERIKKLKEKREALRLKNGGEKTAGGSIISEEKVTKSNIHSVHANEEDEDEEDDDSDDDDNSDWDGFRLKG